MFMERPAGCSWNSWPDAVECAPYTRSSITTPPISIRRSALGSLAIRAGPSTSRQLPLLAQRRRKLLRHAHQETAQARRVPLYRRPPGRHQPLLAEHNQTQALRLDGPIPTPSSPPSTEGSKCWSQSTRPVDGAGGPSGRPPALNASAARSTGTVRVRRPFRRPGPAFSLPFGRMHTARICSVHALCITCASNDLSLYNHCGVTEFLLSLPATSRRLPWAEAIPGIRCSAFDFDLDVFRDDCRSAPGKRIDSDMDTLVPIPRAAGVVHRSREPAYVALVEHALVVQDDRPSGPTTPKDCTSPAWAPNTSAHRTSASGSRTFWPRR